MIRVASCAVQGRPSMIDQPFFSATFFVRPRGFSTRAIYLSFFAAAYILILFGTTTGRAFTRIVISA